MHLWVRGKDPEWIVTSGQLEHSDHEASTAHSVRRKPITKALSERVANLRALGTPAKAICQIEDVSMRQVYRSGVVPVASDSWDSHVLIEYLLQKKSQTDGYQVAYEVDSSNSLQAVAWMAKEQRQIGRMFSDVLTMDTTFGMTKLSFKLAVVCAVDSHHKTRLVMAAFLARETGDMFSWFFRHLEEFLGISPHFIMSDRDRAIREAMEGSRSRHLLCHWHIEQNLAKGARGPVCAVLVAAFKELANAPTCETYQTRFAAAMEALTGNDNAQASLRSLDAIREKWALPFITPKPAMLPRSSQRVESFNSSLKKRRYAKRSLLAVWQHIVDVTGLVDSNVRALEDAPPPRDLQSMGSIMRQLFHFYSRGVFDIIRPSFSKYGHVEIRDLNAENRNYLVRGSDLMHASVCVSQRCSFLATCTCNDFIRKGFVCLHLLAVANRLGSSSIHEELLVKRWSRSPSLIVESPQVSVTSVAEPLTILSDSSASEILEVETIEKQFSQFLAGGSENVARAAAVLRLLCPPDAATAIISNPANLASKGRPKLTERRKKSALEQNASRKR